MTELLFRTDAYLREAEGTVLGLTPEGGIILATVFGSTLLSFSQEYRASTAIKALRSQLALTVRAVRAASCASVSAPAE